MIFDWFCLCVLRDLDRWSWRITSVSRLRETIESLRKHSNPLSINFPLQAYLGWDFSIEFYLHRKSHKIDVSDRLSNVIRHNHIICVLYLKTKVILLGMFLLILIDHLKMQLGYSLIDLISKTVSLDLRGFMSFDEYWGLKRWLVWLI